LYKDVINITNNKTNSDTEYNVLQALKSLIDEDIKDRFHDFDKFSSLANQYSELFSCFIECDMLHSEKPNNIFETTYEIITKENKENNAFSIKIIGNPGTGKVNFYLSFLIIFSIKSRIIINNTYLSTWVCIVMLKWTNQIHE
jgi:hypothetical protein